MGCETLPIEYYESLAINSDMQVSLSDELINEDEYSNKTLCFFPVMEC